MPEGILRLRVGLICLCTLIAGCNDQADVFTLKLKDDEPRIVIPPHVKGTIAEFAVMVGGGNVPVQAHGVVVGLGDKGSSEVPASLQRRVVEYLAKQHLGSYRMGTAALTPERVLRDKDTSVVLVGGAVPPGAPIGTKFDVYVTALPQTQTQSLEGGVLMPIDLSLAFRGMSTPNTNTQLWAKAAGPIFVNPFIDPSDREQAAKLLTGVVVGGGKVTRHQPVRLQLHRPDYQMADLIQRRVHTRFDPNEEVILSKVAKGRSRSVVEISIPEDYRDDYRHFLELVMHLLIRFGKGGWEGSARRIAEQMEMPVADHRQLALVFEAMGKQVLPILQDLYASKIRGASFYSARAGLRLEDNLAVEVVLRFARSAESAYQLPAIEELGKHPRLSRAGPVLRRLIDDPNEQVRLAAYRSLLKRGDRSAITCIDLPDQFALDVIKTRRNYTIYATQRDEARIVLFGRDMLVNRPVYFEAPDELVTINAFGDSDKLTIFRKVPVRGVISDPVKCDFRVRSLVEAMGRIPEPDENGQVTSLGLTHSQVVGVLYRMCKAGDIPARFVLQPIEAAQRIYAGAATVGRPDLPNN